MQGKLLLWKWSDDYDSSAKRKKQKVKLADITRQFVETGDHPSFGNAEIAAFYSALFQEFDGVQRTPEDAGAEKKFALVSYPIEARISLIPQIAAMGKRFGLNAAEI